MANASQARALISAAETSADTAQVIAEAVTALKMLGNVPSALVKELEIAEAAANIVSKQTKENSAGLGGTGTSYAASRLSTARRREEAAGASDEKKLRPSLLHIEHAVAQDRAARESTPLPTKQKETRTPSSEMGRKKRMGKENTLATPIPPPKNGLQYSPVEAADLLAKGIPGVKTFGIVKHMIEKKIVPVGKSQLYLLRKRHVGDTPVSEDKWAERQGRPPLATLEELGEAIRDGVTNGKTMGQAEMGAALKGLRLQKAASTGLALQTVASPSNKVVKNYLSLGASMPGARTTESATYKTDVRQVAENSLPSTVSYAATVATTHFLPCTNGEKASTSDLAKMVAQALGVSEVFAVNPAVVANTDDTACFACPSFEKEQGAGEVWKLCDAEETGSKRSVWQSESPAFAPGLAVRYTVTTTAAGTLAPLVAAVTGLTQHELPTESCPSGMIVITVPGFCIGASVDVYAQQPGYIVFLAESTAGDSSRGQEFFDWYNENVMDPFIARSRELFDLCPEGAPVPEKATSVLWTDGGIDQLRAITRPARSAKDKKLKQSRTKHSASRSAAEQANDAMAGFRIMKQFNKVVKIKSAPSVALAANLKNALKALKTPGTLVMKSTKENALVAHLATSPYLFAKAFTPSNIISGWRSVGLRGEDSDEPDLNAIFRTCFRGFTQVEHDFVMEKMPDVIRESFRTGHVSDAWFEENGFVLEQRSNGDVMRRDAGMNAEHHHRSKNLTHATQLEMRENLVAKAVLALAEKVLFERQKTQDIHDQNREAVTLLTKLLKLPLSSSPSALEAATLGNFEKLTVPHLKAFYHAREYATWVKPRGSTSYPSKGKADDPGENLIKWAHARRSSPLKLPALEPLVDPAVMAAQAAAATEPNQVTPLTVTLTAPCSVVPTANRFLGDASWVSRVNASLEGRVVHDGRSSYTALADKLEVLVRARFRGHVAGRVKDPTKHDHWCLEWAQDNFPRLAAISVNYSHTKPDLSFISPESSLLSQDLSVFTSARGPQALLEGCYLYASNIDCCVVRSGMTVGEQRNFGVRHEDHEEGSKLMTSEARKSAFYSYFPDKDSGATSLVKRGYFSNLQQLVGLGFDRSDSAAVTVLCSSDPSEGIFLWPSSVLAHIANVNFAGCPKIEDKQLRMVGYLTELFYDLMIAPQSNVSRSPGFEGCLGIFGNTD